MATTAGDIYVRSGASGSFTSVQYVQGGWITVPSASDMSGIYHDRLRDGQIVWVEHTEQLYMSQESLLHSLHQVMTEQITPHHSIPPT